MRAFEEVGVKVGPLVDARGSVQAADSTAIRLCSRGTFIRYPPGQELLYSIETEVADDESFRAGPFPFMETHWETPALALRGEISVKPFLHG